VIVLSRGGGYSPQRLPVLLTSWLDQSSYRLIDDGILEQYMQTELSSNSLQCGHGHSRVRFFPYISKRDDMECQNAFERSFLVSELMLPPCSLRKRAMSIKWLNDLSLFAARSSPDAQGGSDESGKCDPSSIIVVGWLVTDVPDACEVEARNFATKEKEEERVFLRELFSKSSRQRSIQELFPNK